MANSDVTITINATGDSEEIAEYVEQVADQIRAGNISGHVDRDRNWDSDITA